MSFKRKLLGAAPILQSSQNPEEISLTVKGAILTLLPLLAMALNKFGVSQEMLVEMVNAIFGLVGAGIMIWGAVRKFRK